ncbi:MAG: RNA polymerase sigma factor, partial [Gaiellaceae bacterium]
MSAIETPQISDERLARDLAAGDAAAFDELYRRYHAPLGAYGARLLGDRSAGDDVAQIAMLNAYQALRRGSEPLHVRAWLYRIAQRAAFEILTRRRDLVELTDENDRGEDGHTASETRGELVAALASLPDRQRRAYLLREVQGLRVGEIADMLELSAEQVEQALFAARNRLAELLTFGRRLDCETARELSGRSLDLTARRALKSHLRACAACRAEAAPRSARIGLLGP